MKLAQIQLQAGQPDGSLSGSNAVGHQLHMWSITYPLLDQSLSCVIVQSLLETFHQQNKNRKGLRLSSQMVNMDHLHGMGELNLLSLPEDHKLNTPIQLNINHEEFLLSV